MGSCVRFSGVPDSGASQEEIFCFTVVGDDMDVPGGYTHGDSLVCKQCDVANPGDDILAELSNGVVLFRRLQRGGNGDYLIALRSAEILRLNKDGSGATIFAKVLRSGKVR